MPTVVAGFPPDAFSEDGLSASAELNGDFLASKGDKLIATAECVRDGRTTCYYRVSVIDNTGALIAEITTSGYKTN